MALEPLVCPNCHGEVELDAEQEFGFCKYCGTKVQNIRADKVKISGKVKIDETEFVEKQLKNARRAKAKEDWEETEKYYNLVEQNDPSNIEAIFYSSFGKAKTSLISSDLYKRQAAFKVLKNCISIIDDNFDSSKENNKEIIQQISDDILAMYNSEYVYNKKINGYGIETYNDSLQTVTLFNEVSAAFMESMDHIAVSYSDESKEEKEFYLTLALEHAEFIKEHGRVDQGPWIERIKEYHERIHALNPEHEIPNISRSSNGKKSGLIALIVLYVSCYIPLLGFFAFLYYKKDRPIIAGIALVITIINLYIVCNSIFGY